MRKRERKEDRGEEVGRRKTKNDLGSLTVVVSSAASANPAFGPPDGSGWLSSCG